MNNPQTRSQQRAQHALRWIQEQEKKHDLKPENKKKLRSYAASLPAMIQMNGLGQTAAFCRSKKETEYGLLYDTLSSWLIQGDQPCAPKEKDSKTTWDLLQAIAQRDMGTYRAAQAEALAYLDWVKRFAQAYLTVPKSTAASQESASEADTGTDAETETGEAGP